MNPVRIEYFGHACFRISCGGQRIVLDPYSDGSVPGLKKLRLDAEFVYCSHEHGDHNSVSCVRISDGGKPQFRMKELLTDHDDACGSKRGKNVIRIFDFYGIRVAHFGDLGRALTKDEISALRGLDCIMIPVGGYYTIDADMASRIVRELQPRLAIPMHYRTEHSGYEVLADVDDAMGKFDEDADVITLTVGGYAEIENGG